MPEGTGKRWLECLKAMSAENETWSAGRVPASVAWSKGWLARVGRPEYVPEDIAGQIRGYKKQTAP